MTLEKLLSDLTTFTAAPHVNDRDVIGLRRDASDLATKIHKVMASQSTKAAHAALVETCRDLVDGRDSVPVAEMTGATGASGDAVAAAMADLGFEQVTRNHVRTFCRAGK